jgi:hypothetical protein
MNKLTRTEKKEITKDWSGLLREYGLYQPLHFLKRNGPILTGVYLQPVSAGCKYRPQFHIHSLMKPFSDISLSPIFPLINKKNASISISYKRHCDEFDQIALEFKSQLPEAFIGRIDCKTIDKLYNRSISNDVGYPYNDMRDHILLLYWCGYDSLAEENIKKYKGMIKSWPEGVITKVNGEDGWEHDVRELMDMKTIDNTISAEIDKFNLTKFQDYGLICE